MKHRFSFLIALFLAACGAKDAAAPDAKAVERAQSLTPPDARLAMLYTQSCKLCHTMPQSLAPLTGDRKAWAARLEKGLPALNQSVIVGLNGMPPGGQCFACTAQDYEALIKFMAGRE